MDVHNHDATVTNPSEVKKWTVAVALGLLSGALSSWYMVYVYGTFGTLAFWSSVSAATASFLLAMAFAAGSVSYFTGWPNMRLGYQKQIGVLAFWLCLFYCFTLLALFPEIYYYGFWDNLFTPDISLGLLAMVILGAMTVSNTKFMSRFIAWDTVKFILGLGFVAYAALVMRAVFLEWPQWEAWLTTFDGFPTNRFILSMIAIVVLLLRVTVAIHRDCIAPPRTKK